ncbi:MAG: hypothetical protein B655_1584 [Methanobacterium sp. Maddingley MBC34]|nr:MAG: hypothetical protein B655_1584 [Methanobacterium sp. Maddingley MBC34]
MRVNKTVSLQHETLKKLETVFGDIDTINFSRLADTAILNYVNSIQK